MVMLSMVRVLHPDLQGAPTLRVLPDQPDLLLLRLADQQPHQVGEAHSIKVTTQTYNISSHTI